MLHNGDVIYLLNFKTNQIGKYNITNIVDFDKDPENQLQLTLKYISSYALHEDKINVWKHNSFEQYRELIGKNDNVYWCTDKKAMINAFHEYLISEQSHIAEMIKKINNDE